MTQEKIYQLLQQREGLHVEFKLAQGTLPKTLFETICGFLNRDGGTIVLGVDDSGNIKGIDRAHLEKERRPDPRRRRDFCTGAQGQKSSEFGHRVR